MDLRQRLATATVRQEEEQEQELAGNRDGGDERFIFGSKRGQTFRQVARDDPSYHLRCSATGYKPVPDQMDRYLEYFDRYGNQYAAARNERDAIGFAICYWNLPYRLVWPV